MTSLAGNCRRTTAASWEDIAAEMGTPVPEPLDISRRLRCLARLLSDRPFASLEGSCENKTSKR